MSFGLQGSSSDSKGYQGSDSNSNSRSLGQSEYGSESVQHSRGTSFGESSGTSASQGTSSGQSFGFSGLRPTDSATVSSALTGQITNALPAINQAANAQINLPTLTERGLYVAQENAANQAVRDAVAQMSSNAATRGQLQPENVSAVAGSAVQNILPQLMPVISQNIQAAARAPLDTALARAQGTAQLLQAFPGLLGQQSTSQQQSQQTASSEQRARSQSEQVADALSKAFGRSLSQAISEAVSTSHGETESSSFGFGLSGGK